MSPPENGAPAGPTREAMLYDSVCERYEYKYLIPPEQVEPIRTFLRPYCAIDRHAARAPQGRYTITSLYLDTTDFRTFWDKIEERPVRFKIRVRTYGEDNEGPVKFEIKRRVNDLFLKTSVVVCKERWPAALKGPLNGFADELSGGQMTIFNEFTRLVRTFGAVPRMGIRYKRLAFTSLVDRYARVSLDSSLRYLPARDYAFHGRASTWRPMDQPSCMKEPGPRVVLELKFADRAPVWMVDMVRTFGLSQRGFSKYCTAVSRTLKERVVSWDMAMAVPLTPSRMRSKSWT